MIFFSQPVHQMAKFISFFSFSCDYVDLISSTGQILQRYIGTRSPFNHKVFGNTTLTLRVRFTSDSSVRRSGFLASYTVTSRKYFIVVGERETSGVKSVLPLNALLQHICNFKATTAVKTHHILSMSKTVSLKIR